MAPVKSAFLFATSGHSGVDRILKNLLPEFGNVDCDFDLLTIPRHGPYLENTPPNVSLRCLPALGKDTVLPGIVWYLYRYRPNSLLTANHKLNCAALMARRITGVPTRIAIRMGISVTAKMNEMNPAHSKRLQNSMLRWYPLANVVITPSHGVGRDLMSLAGVNPQNLRIIPNPVITEELAALCRQQVDHSWFAPEEDYPIIVSVGSLEPRKDFATLVDAFARVRSRRTCRLVILGEGKEREKLIDRTRQLNISEDVDLPGFKSNPYPYMSNASIFVLSSHREGSPVAIVEALACGTPVVSTDCPSGPSETLRDGEVGKLVPIGDSKAMARAIDQTLDNPPSSDFLTDAVSEHRADLAAERYLKAMGIEK